MSYEEQNMAQNASIYISLENIVNESENKTKQNRHKEIFDWY